MSALVNHENYNCTVTTADGREFNVYANWLHNNQLDQWKGWTCDAGATRILIDKDFNVFSGECFNDILGNAASDFNLLESSICKKDRCTGCTDDLAVKKEAPKGLI